jgi:hypothetical protein
MIPSKRWFPRNLTEQAAWLQNFALQLSVVGSTFGITPAEITQMTQDAADFQSIVRTTFAADAFMKGLKEFRLSVAEAKIGSPTPTFPAITFSAPPNGVPAGIFQRLDSLVRRIRAAVAYTDETGAMLGIIPAKNADLNHDELQPSIKAFALPPNVVEIAFTRGQTHGISIEIKIDKDEKWTPAGRFFKSPARLNIPDGTGLPRAVQIRARYLDGNLAIGQNSDIINIVTLP